MGKHSPRRRCGHRAIDPRRSGDGRRRHRTCRGERSGCSRTTRRWASSATSTLDTSGPMRSPRSGRSGSRCEKSEDLANRSAVSVVRAWPRRGVAGRRSLMGSRARYLAIGGSRGSVTAVAVGVANAGGPQGQATEPTPDAPLVARAERCERSGQRGNPNKGDPDAAGYAVVEIDRPGRQVCVLGLRTAAVTGQIHRSTSTKLAGEGERPRRRRLRAAAGDGRRRMRTGGRQDLAVRHRCVPGGVLRERALGSGLPGRSGPRPAPRAGGPDLDHPAARRPHPRRRLQIRRRQTRRARTRRAQTPARRTRRAPDTSGPDDHAASHKSVPAVTAAIGWPTSVEARAILTGSRLRCGGRPPGVRVAFVTAACFTARHERGGGWFAAVRAAAGRR